MITDEQIERALAVCAAATPGPMVKEHWPELSAIHAIVCLVNPLPGREEERGVAGFLGIDQAEADRDADAYVAAADPASGYVAALRELSAARAHLREIDEAIDEEPPGYRLAEVEKLRRAWREAHSAPAAPAE